MGANASREGPAPLTQNNSPSSMPASSDLTPPATCPIDHKAREAWLQQARSTGETVPHPLPPQAVPVTRTAKEKLPLPSPSTDKSCDSASMNQSLSIPPTASPLGLGVSRVISTIPRASSSPSQGNAESETGKDATSGNWVYPSEQQFFDAMKRKNHAPQPRDMSNIVPIHNAVNERAWSHILTWERGQGSEACGGPKLVSFEGNSGKLTPRARWYGLLGYTMPFDRHDWVVDRCGTKIEYVIDFYKGRGTDLSFYLDVRPKLNSVEGVKMRVLRFFGA